MTKAVDHLQDTLGSRLTAVERENSELKASVKALKDAQTDTDHGSRAGSDDGALDEDQKRRTLYARDAHIFTKGCWQQSGGRTRRGPWLLRRRRRISNTA